MRARYVMAVAAIAMLESGGKGAAAETIPAIKGQKLTLTLSRRDVSACTLKLNLSEIAYDDMREFHVSGILTYPLNGRDMKRTLTQKFGQRAGTLETEKYEHLPLPNCQTLSLRLDRLRCHVPGKPPFDCRGHIKIVNRANLPLKVGPF